MRRVCRSLCAGALVLAAAACGEVETLTLSQRPSPEDFAQVIHPMLVSIGCSENGRCHTNVSGELRIAPAAGAGDLEQDFLLVRAFIDLDAPDESPILTTLLRGNPMPTHRPSYCFESVNDCSYRKLRAWIAWSGPPDPRPQDIDCDYAAEGCP